MNPGGPPPKAKYSLATDSEQVRRLKNEKYPVEGSEIVPETIHLQAVGALWRYSICGVLSAGRIETGHIKYVRVLSVV